MKKKYLVHVLAGIFLYCAFANNIYASTFNFERDFSTTTNSTNNTWSYLYQADGLSRDGNYELLPTLVDYTAGIQEWRINPTRSPMIGINASGSDFSQNSFHWANGMSRLHPSNSNLVVVSWLSPHTGNFAVSYLFEDLDDGAGSVYAEKDGVNWFIDKGNSLGNLMSGNLLNGASSELASLDVFMHAGEQLNFVIDPGNNYYHDSTRLFVEIAPVPIPGAIWLLGSGFIGLVALKKKIRVRSSLLTPIKWDEII